MILPMIGRPIVTMSLSIIFTIINPLFSTMKYDYIDIK